MADFREIAALTGAELFEVVRRPHPTDVKKILVLADTQRSGLVGFPFRRKAPDGDFGFIHRNRADHADLRRELIHQVDIGVQAQVAGFVDHLVGTAFAEFRLQPFAVGIDRAHFRVERPVHNSIWPLSNP